MPDPISPMPMNPTRSIRRILGTGPNFLVAAAAFS